MPSNQKNIDDEVGTECSDELELRRLVIEKRQQKMLANLGKTVQEIEKDYFNKNPSSED